MLANILSAEKKQAGKPSVKTFEEAERTLGTPPEWAFVLKDAIYGVQAGRTVGFGVARGDDSEILRRHVPM